MDTTKEDSRALSVAIQDVITLLQNTLLGKLAEYGPSALSPTRIFSDAAPIETINARIDDKLRRIFSGDKTEDAELDLIGYLILKRACTKVQLARLVRDLSSSGIAVANDGASSASNGVSTRASSGDDSDSRANEMSQHAGSSPVVPLSKKQAIAVINGEFASVAKMFAAKMIEKNIAYAGSAFTDSGFFSRLSLMQKIEVRLDDKISRLANRKDKGQFTDSHFDLMGYLMVYMVASKLEERGTLRGISEVLKG